MALCPSCGEENPDRARFCLICGSPLAVEETSGGEERKVVSILFVDLVGFTARSHAADPEDVRAALNRYYALLKREIERFGGTVEKFIGDAVMAVFGAPVAHEDDAERAVRAALRVVKAIAELNETSSLDLSVRAAVNSGEALITLTARKAAGESLVTGDVVNTASRLQNVAPVNGTLVGEVTYRSTKDVIDYEELEPVMVKGKPEPVAVWRALSARSRLGVDVEMTPKAPFIGREFELTTLKTAYQRARRDSSLQLVTIVGEPGVGKSRVLAEFSSFIDEQEELIVWRQGRSLPYGEGITFWALSEIVKAQAGILESDSSGDATEKLRSAIAAVLNEGGEQAWFLSRLGPLVGVEVTGGATPPKEELFTAWRRFLEAIAERNAVVLVFEDLHWADPSLLEFIDHLVDWVSGVPMFVVCTARPELYDKRPSWGGGKRNIMVISLSPLNDSETAQLISSLLSQAVLPAEIHTALLERAGGNPLYAEEFVRMLSDRGILTRRGRVLTLARDAEILVPESVQALIAARLDTLSPERKSLLHDASIAGKVFWSGAVAAIGNSDPQLVRQGLHELGAKEWVRMARASSVEGQQEFSFWHALIRDVCYGQIPRAARITKHQAMAAWIEASAERLDDNAEVLAHHYSTALALARATGSPLVEQLAERASRFLLIAADRALKLDAAAALSLYREALELLDADDPDLPAVVRGAGFACRFLGLFAEAEDYLWRSIAAFSKQNDLEGQAGALTALSLLIRDGRPDEGRTLAARAIDLLERQPPGEGLARAYMAFGWFELLGGSDTIAWADKAVRVAEICGAHDALALCLDLRGVVRCDSGDLDGLEDLRRAVQLREGEGYPGAYTNLADRIALIDGPSQGLALNERAQSLGRSFGHVHTALWAKMSSLSMLFEAGLWDKALEESAEVEEWAVSHGFSLMERGAILLAAPISFHRGDLSKTPDLEELLPHFRKQDDLEELIPALALLALMYASTGNAADATRMIEEFDLKTERAPLFRARYLPDVLRAAVIVESLGRLSQLLVEEDQIVYPHDRHMLATARAIVAEAEGKWEQALSLYNDAAQRWHEYGFVLEEGQALLGAGRCLIAAGRRMEASPRLQEALEIFTELGAAPLIEETNDCLKQAIALSS